MHAALETGAAHLGGRGVWTCTGMSDGCVTLTSARGEFHDFYYVILTFSAAKYEKIGSFTYVITM